VKQSVSLFEPELFFFLVYLLLFLSHIVSLLLHSIIYDYYEHQNSSSCQCVCVCVCVCVSVCAWVWVLVCRVNKGGYTSSCWSWLLLVAKRHFCSSFLSQAHLKPSEAGTQRRRSLTPGRCCRAPPEEDY